MAVVRRFHALSLSRGLPYCVIGGVAVFRNGLAQTTDDVDVLTFKKAWRKASPLDGEIRSFSLGLCQDRETGVWIDVLFADENWRMPIPMPDPRKVGANVFELISRNLPKFSPEVIQTYDRGVRKECLRAYESAVRHSHREKSPHRPTER